MQRLEITNQTINSNVVCMGIRYNAIIHVGYLAQSSSARLSLYGDCVL